MARPTEHPERRSGSVHPDRPTIPDEFERYQRPDGSFESPALIDTADGPMSPDVYEQHQRLDGSYEAASSLDVDPEGVLSADMLDQRREVEDEDTPT